MNGKFWGNIALGAVIFCLISLAVTKISASSGVERLFSSQVNVSDAAEELLCSLNLIRSDLTIQEQGHHVEAVFGVENRGERDIKNISISCALYDADGKSKGRDSWTVYDTVKSMEYGVYSFLEKRYISDSVVRSECRLVSAELVKEPFIAVHQVEGGHGGGHEKGGHGENHGGSAH